jgi:hypothetical protein
LDDGVTESLLGEFKGSILHLLNVCTNVIGWMALILNAETCFLDFTNGCLELLIIWSKKYATFNKTMKVISPLKNTQLSIMEALYLREVKFSTRYSFHTQPSCFWP